MKTYANLAICCVLKDFSMSSNDIAKNESTIGKPSVLHGSAKPTSLLVSGSTST